MRYREKKGESQWKQKERKYLTTKDLIKYVTNTYERDYTKIELPATTVAESKDDTTQT